jgi:hypothetical protein
MLVVAVVVVGLPVIRVLLLVVLAEVVMAVQAQMLQQEQPILAVEVAAVQILFPRRTRAVQVVLALLLLDTQSDRKSHGALRRNRFKQQSLTSNRCSRRT